LSLALLLRAPAEDVKGFGCCTHQAPEQSHHTHPKTGLGVSASSPCKLHFITVLYRAFACYYMRRLYPSGKHNPFAEAFMNITRKPIKKCNGCPLNLKKRCGVYEVPRLMWEKGKCPGYYNEELFLQYEESQATMEAKEVARRKRKEIQALRKTESHHAGNQYTLVSAALAPGRKKSNALHANYVTTGKRAAKVARAAAFLASGGKKLSRPRVKRAYR